MITAPSQHEIETYTGRYVDIAQPPAEAITLQDIATALSRVCRFGGHTRRHYSVAEHAVLCSRYAERRGWTPAEQLACLHHDDAEAYLGDIPRPYKKLLGPSYGRLTAMMDAAIVEALQLPFGVEALHHYHVKEADRWALMVEAHSFLQSRGEGWADQIQAWDLDITARAIRGLPGPLFRLPRPCWVAEQRFIAHHVKLMEKL